MSKEPNTLELINKVNEELNKMKVEYPLIMLIDRDVEEQLKLITIPLNKEVEYEQRT